MNCSKAEAKTTDHRSSVAHLLVGYEARPADMLAFLWTYLDFGPVSRGRHHSKDTKKASCLGWEAQGQIFPLESSILRMHQSLAAVRAGRNVCLSTGEFVFISSHGCPPAPAVDEPQCGIGIYKEPAAALICNPNLRPVHASVFLSFSPDVGQLPTPLD